MASVDAKTGHNSVDSAEISAVTQAELKWSSEAFTAMVVLLITTVLGALFYFETLVSIYSTWMFEEYSHGFIIVPISAFLAWRKRSILVQTPVRHSRIGVLIVAGLSLLWWLSQIFGVQIVSQFAAVGLIPAMVLTVFGWEWLRILSFPLFYLVFAVPFGEFLIPYLIDFTAVFSVIALTLFGIPVVQDGQYFHVPSGSYEVARACSGFKFLAATVALTTLYSYRLFSRLEKALYFVLFAVGLSIIANGVRATAIVLLLHYTNLDIAAGKDHEFVGWIVFGIMFMLLIVIGWKFGDFVRDRDFLPGKIVGFAALYDNRRIFADSLLAVSIAMAISVGPAIDYASQRTSADSTDSELTLPGYIADWQRSETHLSTLQPAYIGYANTLTGSYFRDSDVVELAFVSYLSQSQGAEITDPANSVVDLNVWKIVRVDQRMVEVDDSFSLPVSEVNARSAFGTQLIWRWTEINGRPMRGKMQIKFAEILNVVMGRSLLSLEVIVSAPGPDDIRTKRRRLLEYVQSLCSSENRCGEYALSFPGCNATSSKPKDTRCAE